MVKFNFLKNNYQWLFKIINIERNTPKMSYTYDEELMKRPVNINEELFFTLEY